MFKEYIQKIIEDAYDKAYQDGFSAGYNAKALEEKKEYTDRELKLYEYGYMQGKADTEAEIGVIDLNDIKAEA